MDIICGVEEGLRKVNHAAAVSTARSKVAGVLKTARPPTRNIDEENDNDIYSKLVTKRNPLNSITKNVNGFA